MSRKLEILTITSQKIRTFGYDGFSYADIATEIGITKASLHYHFSSKELLVITLCDYIEDHWQSNISHIIKQESQNTALQQMTRFILNNVNTLKSCEICSLTSLLNDYETLPEGLQNRVYALIQFEYQLYANLIEKAVIQKEVDATLAVDNAAAELISLVKGALIYRRVGKEIGSHFNHIEKILLNLYRSWGN